MSDSFDSRMAGHRSCCNFAAVAVVAASCFGSEAVEVEVENRMVGSSLTAVVGVAGIYLEWDMVSSMGLELVRVLGSWACRMWVLASEMVAVAVVVRFDIDSGIDLIRYHVAVLESGHIVDLA